MRFQDCIRFANEHPVCYMATINEEQPRVRRFLLWFADERGFYFHVGASKDICKELKYNPKVEVCFYASETHPNVGKMMRVTGEVELLDNKELIKRLLEERPSLKEIGKEKPEDFSLVILHIYKGKAHFWTIENNIKELEIESISFY